MKTEHKTLDSGLNIYLFKNNSPVSMFQLYVPFGGDVLQYKDSKSREIMNIQPGSAHYFEHVLFIMPPLGKNGKEIKWRTNTPKTKRGLRDGVAVLENNRAIVNAYTWNDITNFWFISRENQIENLKTMVDYVFTPYLPRDRFKKEVGTILDEASRGDNNPNEKQFDDLMMQLYKNHGSRFPVIGTLESIKKISLEDVLSMHDTFYTPSNMGLIVIGNVEMEEVAEKVKQELERLGEGQYILPPEEIDQGETDGVVKKDNFDSPLLREDVVNKKILGGCKYIINPLTKSKEELIDLYITSSIISSSLFGNGSKNKEELIKKGMDQRTFSGESSEFRDHGTIYFGGNSSEPEKFRDLIISSFEKIITKGIPKTEIRYSKNDILRDFYFQQENLEELGTDLVRFGILTKDPRDYLKVLERIENITEEEINSLIPKILNLENLSFNLMAPKIEAVNKS